MSESKKRWVIIAVVLVILGLSVFLGTMIALKFDFNKLSTMQIETNTYTMEDSFDRINIAVDTADVTFVPTTDHACKVVCEEPERLKHTVSINDGTLVINTVDTRKWYDYIGIGFWRTTVTVYLPEDAYESLSVDSSTGNIKIPKEFAFEAIEITTSTGDIILEGLSAGEVSLYASTGDININSVSVEDCMDCVTNTGEIDLENVTCAGLNAESNTGEVMLRQLIAADGISIYNATGDIEFEGCDAGWIYVETSTGDVTGTLLSEKIFIAESSTGDIRVPKSTAGGKCEIITSTGDIEMDIQEP